MSPYDVTERRAGYFFILIFTFLAIGISSTGYFYYRYHERYFRADMENHLSGVAKLKVGELALWRRERLADGAILLKNTAFSNLVRRFLENPEDKNAQQLLWVWIGAHMKSYQYKGVSLFDTHAALRMSAPEDWGQIDAYSVENISGIMRQGRVDFLDFHRDTPDGAVHLSVVIPIFSEPDFSRPLGIIVFDIDPQTYLYPLINKAPSPTQTAETLLVRRDGDSVLFLNELRFRKNTALNLRIPLTQTNVPAVMAALGYEGVVEGVDYHGKPVIAVIKAVPNSPWSLVSKIDISEVYEPLEEQLWLVSITVAGLLLGAGAAVFVVWRQQSLRYYRERFEATRAVRESEARLNATQHQAKIGGWEFNVEKQTVFWTDEAYRIHDLEPVVGDPTAQEHIEKSLECYDPVDRPVILAAFQRCAQEGEPYDLEFPFTTVKGRKLWIRTMASPVFDNGKVVKVIGNITDITERKRVENKLIASQNELSNAQQIAHLGNWDLNLKTGKGTWSDETYRIFGFEPGAFEPTFDKFMECVHPEDRKIVEEYYPEIFSGRQSRVEFDFRIIRPDGEERILHDKMEVATHENGKPVKVIGVNLDITERKRSEEALVQSERKYRSLFTNMRNGFAYCEMIFDENNQPVDWIYLQINDAFERVIGLKKEAVEGKRVTEIFPGIRDFRPNLFEIYGKVALTGEGTEFTICFDILNIWLAISVYCPQPGYFAAVFDDVTDLKKAEIALLESEELHRAIMETANDAVICIDLNGKVCMWNRRAEEMFGYTAQEAMGKNVHEFITPKKYQERARAGFAKFLLTGEGPIINKTTEITALRRDGSEFPVELSVAAVKMKDGWGASAIIKDITARKEWENKLTETNEKLKKAMDDIERTHALLIRQEKLAAMGQLSAGVAHEIKNPLNIISTSTQLMMMEDGLPGEAMESGKIIMEQIARAVKIIDNLREFARERKPERKEVYLNQFLDKTISLVAYEMRGEGIEIAMEFSPEPIRIMGDEDQLAQVFLNITNNARDSMNMKKKSYSFEEAEKIGWKAKLTVRTLVEEGKAKISFEDTGVGISEENKRKLFTPFFTTKGETKGTGLGIAIAFGIIENHGGTIEFESEEGKGAAFTVTIPLAG